MTRRAIHARNAAAVGPYSHAVQAGDLLFLSGQVPVDPATGMLASDDIRAQTAQCLSNLFSVLEAAGLSPADVVNAQIHLTDMREFQAMNEVYATHFSAPYPARTTLGVASLPRDAKIEIALTAYCKVGSGYSKIAARRGEDPATPNISSASRRKGPK